MDRKIKRISLSIDKNTLSELKQLAVLDGRSLSNYVTQLLKKHVLDKQDERRKDEN